MTDSQAGAMPNKQLFITEYIVVYIYLKSRISIITIDLIIYFWPCHKPLHLQINTHIKQERWSDREGMLWQLTKTK